MTLQSDSRFDPIDNPWQIRDEELPSSFRFTPPENAVQDKKHGTAQPLRLILIGLLSASLWIFIQSSLLEPENPTPDLSSIPGIPVGKPVIVPAPIRYYLLQEASAKVEPPPPPRLPALAGLNRPDVHDPVIPIHLTSPMMPVESGNLLPPPAAGPGFRLLGIAQGAEGAVATLKVDDETAAIKNQLQDVREGATILGDYRITRITSEYVLIKDGKTGKTIRVE